MMAYVRLPGRCLAPYHGDTDSLVDEAAWFILRGFGVKDEVIAEHFAKEEESLLPTAAAE
jgi:hypothetical protein